MLRSVLDQGIHAAVAWVVGLLLAVAVHEFAHARAAHALGDSTAADEGRMTLNPFKHLSLWGTLFLLFFGLGWSEPVPVDPRNFRQPRRDGLLTAFAGPASNLAVAGALGVLAQFLPLDSRLPALVATMIFVNCLLAFFNLIPIPPLDGSSILPYFFPQQPFFLLRLQQQGVLILLLLILADSVFQGRVLGTLVLLPARFFTSVFLGAPLGL